MTPPRAISVGAITQDPAAGQTRSPVINSVIGGDLRMKMKSMLSAFAVAVLLAASLAAFLPNENTNVYEEGGGRSVFPAALYM